MTAPVRRLAAFAVLLGALFTGGWAVGARFPTDEAPSHEVDHVHTGAATGGDPGAGTDAQDEGTP